MLNQILTLSKQFISIPSTKENPGWLKRILEIAENEVRGYKIEKFEKDGVFSFLAYNTKTRPKRFKIILNAHLDVVSAKDYQYNPYEKGGRLYGRGANDMKAAAAVMILVFKELAKKLNYPAALQLVTDEETGGFNGTKYQIDQGVRADFIIAGEGSNLAIKNQAKGIIWGKIKSRGQTAHGAYPWQGKNAIWKANEILNQIKKVFPEHKKEIWKTTINIARIETSNQTFNQVPEDCLISFDLRYIPEDKDKVIKKIKEILPKDSKLEFLLKEPAQFTPESNQYIKALKKAAKKITGKKALIIARHGGSDIRHFNRVGCSGVEFGPKGEGLHTDNEWVYIRSLEEYYKILKDFLLRL